MDVMDFTCSTACHIFCCYDHITRTRRRTRVPIDAFFIASLCKPLPPSLRLIVQAPQTAAAEAGKNFPYESRFRFQMTQK